MRKCHFHGRENGFYRSLCGVAYNGIVIKTQHKQEVPGMKTHRSVRIKMALLLFLVLFTSVSGKKAYAGQSKSKTVKLEVTQGSKTKAFLTPGDKVRLQVKGVSGKKIKWSSSKQKVAVVTKKGVVTAKRTGKALITGKYKGKKIKCRVIVLSKKKYVKEWAKNWVQAHIEADDDDFGRVLLASYFVSHYFTYGRSGSAFEMLKTGKGTCYSGGLLLVELLEAMGYKAKVRFAAKDDMSRYPAGITFMSQHYNVRVVIKGKSYYVDGTPESMCVYLSSSKKPLYYYTDWM